MLGENGKLKKPRKLRGSKRNNYNIKAKTAGRLLSDDNNVGIVDTNRIGTKTNDCQFLSIVHILNTMNVLKQ